MAELTPEERQKIYEEEKARMEIRSELQKASSSTSTKSLLTNGISLMGTFLMIIGLFMPWARMGLISISGFDKIGETKAILLVGILAGLFAIMGLITKVNLAFLHVLFGAIGGGLTYWGYSILSAHLAEFTSKLFQPEISSGLWLTASGCAVVLIGGLMGAEKKAASPAK